MRFTKTIRVALSIAAVAALRAHAGEQATAKPKVEPLTVTSKTITEGKTIPTKNTGDGKDISPDLTWSKPPATAKSIAITCEDPDAPGGTWFHWILFNLKPTTTVLNENVAKTGSLPDGSAQGVNDFGKPGYNGPAPPKGQEHRYNFKVFALDTKLDLKALCNKKQFYEALSGHVVGRGKLTGLYKR